MSQPATHAVLVSEAEFLSLPETNQRIELLDGEVIIPPSPTWRHQSIVSQLHDVLKPWVVAHPPAFLGLSPLDVHFGPSRILQPDLFVVLNGIQPDASMPLTVVPDLVVEVLSGARAYDRFTKRVVYQEAGVAEYWVVDRASECVEVYLPDARTEVRDVLRSELLSGFSVPVAQLFR